MPKITESAPSKGARASPPSSASASKRSAAERFPARQLAKRHRLDPFPEFIEPCLASLAADVPGGDRWLHEIKWDGYRLHVRVESGRVRLLTRRGLDWTARFSPVADAAARLPFQTPPTSTAKPSWITGLASRILAPCNRRSRPGRLVTRSYSLSTFCTSMSGI